MKNRLLFILIGSVIFGLAAPLCAMEGSDPSNNKKRGRDELQTPKDEDQKREEEEKKRILEKRALALERLKKAQKNVAEQAKKFEAANSAPEDCPTKIEKNEKLAGDQNKDEKEADLCGICKEPLISAATMVLACGHCYHASCLHSWYAGEHAAELDDIMAGKLSNQLLEEKCVYCKQPCKMRVDELCKGKLSYLQGLSLKDKVADLASLPSICILETLSAVANLSPEERKKIFEPGDAGHLMVQRAIVDKIRSQRDLLADDVTRLVVNAAVTVLDNKPLTKEFVKKIWKYLDNDKKVGCFERAYACQETLKTPQELFDDFVDIEVEDGTDQLELVDYILTWRLCRRCLNALPQNLRNTYFLKWLEKKEPMSGSLRAPFLRALFGGFSRDMLVQLFVDIRPQLSDKCKKIVLKSIVWAPNGGYGALISLFEQGVLPRATQIRFKLIERSFPLDERLKILEYLAYPFFCDTLKELVKSNYVIDEKIARTIQRCLLLAQGSGKKEIDNALLLIGNHQLYKEFYRSFSHRFFSPQQQATYFLRARDTTEPIFSDTEILDQENINEEVAKRDEYLERRHYLELTAFYEACPRTLPNEQLASLQLLIETETKYADLKEGSIKKIIGMLDLRELALVKNCEKATSYFAKFYPLIKSNPMKVFVLLMQFTALQQQKKQEKQEKQEVEERLCELMKHAAALTFDDSDTWLSPSVAHAFLNSFWPALSKTQRLWLFSRMLDEKFICRYEPMNSEFCNGGAAACVVDLFEWLKGHGVDEQAYIDVIVANVACSNKIFSGQYFASMHKTILEAIFSHPKLGESALSLRLYRCLQKNMQQCVLEGGGVIEKNARRIALCETVWSFFKNRRTQTLLLAEILPHLTASEVNEVFLKKLGEKFPIGLIQQLLTTTATERGKLLADYWSSCEAKYRGAIFMVVSCLPEIEKMKAIDIITKLSNWPVGFDLVEKQWVLAFLCKNDFQNHAAHYEALLKSCETEKDRGALAKSYKELGGTQLQGATLNLNLHGMSSGTASK